MVSSKAYIYRLKKAVELIPNCAMSEMFPCVDVTGDGWKVNRLETEYEHGTEAKTASS